MTPQELRSSILLAAFSGDFVLPNENDSIEAYLNKVYEKQKELSDKKMIKIGKYDKTINYDGQIPKGWICTKIGSISSLVTKQTGFDYSKVIKPSLIESPTPGSLPLIQTRNFKGKSFDFDSKFYVPKEITDLYPNLVLNKKCILLSIVGASIGNVGYFDFNEIGFLGGAIAKIDLIDNEIIDFLYYYLQSPYGYKQIMANYKACAQGTITVENVRNIIVPMPSIEEQKRIVSKIEKLMPFVDEYEASYNKIEMLHNQFPLELKKSILKFAFEGKLVEQLSIEGTGYELYERIKSEKDTNLKKELLKQAQQLSRIGEDEIPFSIPSSWKWVRIGEIFCHSAGKSLNSSDKEGKEYKYITTSNVYWNSFILDDLKSMFYKESELEKCTAKKGDLLILEGGDIGRAAIWNYDYDIKIQNHIHRLRPISEIYVKFYYYVFYLYKNSNWIEGKGIGLKGLSANKLKSIVVPLPPFEEQKRIVNKIEELFSKCDELII